ncbi:hypothetical protein EKO04_001011 [Ascochyta lentis]|uniref:F-box domain-containing protein n=1 Tax=Ascochyta lentis TaxID=205686 RepID=A0A8H7JDT7_9PLEO|nr:hypothetical protein EKO04_001011 [Ascochyta lentis]
MRNLPRPILLIIASYLSQNDLCSFALVARNFVQAGQDTLYQHPIVPPPHKTDREDQTFNFLRTILDNAALAAKVRSIELYPQQEAVEQQQVRHVTIDPAALSRTAPHRLGKLKNSSSLVSEYALTGAILWNLPNLEDLRYEVYCPIDGLMPGLTKFGWFEARAQWPLELMFGAKKKINFVPGLKRLKRLRLTAPHIERRWCELPMLEYLYVGFDSDMEQRSHQSVGKSPIRTMEMECSTWALQEYGFYGPMKDFFKGFDHLTHLTLRIINQTDPSHRIINDDDTDAEDNQTDNLLTYLEHVSSKLKTLRILVHADPRGFHAYFVTWVEPASNWASFTELRHLQIPYGLFLIESVENRTKLRVPESFPPKLERLELTCATIETRFSEFLYAVVDRIAGHAQLKEIHIYVSEAWRHEFFKKPGTVTDWGDAWEKLEAAGVSLVIFEGDREGFTPLYDFSTVRRRAESSSSSDTTDSSSSSSSSSDTTD